MDKKIFINGGKVDYDIIRRKIKHPRLEFKTGKLILILPENYKTPEKIIEKHLKWIQDKLEVIEKSRSCKLNFDRDENDLKEDIFRFVSIYSEKMELVPGEIKFRKMKKRWGSCDNKGNLKFNTRMKYLPDKLIEYVVFHEMGHLLEFGHNHNFYDIIFAEYPEYKKLDLELSMYWFAINSQTNNFKDSDN